MRILDIKPDGSEMRMWISAGIDINDNSVFWPQSLHEEICKNIGYPMPVANLGHSDKQLIVDCMQENWMRTMRWWADALHYMIDKHNVDVIFSHVHNDDAQKHMFLKYASEHTEIAGNLSVDDYRDFLVNISIQNDYYIGRFLHLLDEGWTIFLVSDHGLICSKYGPSFLSGATVKATFMRDWGFTEVKYDENGNMLKEIDWSKTQAIYTRMNYIYINLKGKYPTGIVEPEDKYDLESDIISHLYDLKDENGHCRVALALRNKDAVLLGLGGPECGDIVVMLAEESVKDHGDSMSTAIGEANTSTSPIFAAAGKGIKKGFVTNRVIREVDIAPTIAMLGNVRMPAQCEGAPIYQIFE